jgi:D-alanyl-D-alanine-carboxypeptidase/D-alanyl-D-alanine-endopeptidase
MSYRLIASGLLAATWLCAAIGVHAQTLSPTEPTARTTAPTASLVPGDEQIRAILKERVETHRQAVGIVAGIIEPNGRRVVTYGSPAQGDSKPLDGDTVFEIGSLTKVFTSLLLADASLDGRVSLTDPVSKFLPGIRIPERGRPITLQDLSQHVSGLPREVTNIQVPTDTLNPFATYTHAQFYEFLAGHTLQHDPGSHYEYSNAGASLLGLALEKALGASYDELVRTQIAAPLGMKDTAVAVTPSMRTRLAQGYGRRMQPVPPFGAGNGPFVAAGSLHSTANDLLKFLGAAMGNPPSPLSRAFERMLNTRHATHINRLEAGLGWGIFTDGDTVIVSRNGGTTGFRSWIGFDPRRKVGVVLLANSFSPAGPDDIGRHLLNPRYELTKTFATSGAPGPAATAKSPARAATKIDAAAFERHVGRYRISPQQLLMFPATESAFLSRSPGFRPWRFCQKARQLS